jgi:hypothetical protein
MAHKTGVEPRDVNWCSTFGEPEDCFPSDEPCFVFDNSKANLPALLVVSGMFPTYLSALEAGYKGWVEYGWSHIERNGVCCYFWNPDPAWQDKSGDEVVGEKDFFHPDTDEEVNPPWHEAVEEWDAICPFRDV